ncbi:MAG: Asp-tRNA(Asn)/Glu-tRNA(Gln) amidotransferase GatCAB subunit C [Gammaproteobacteria bacterium]|nr:Asp-tRNA(Asn)/Glu-tRNA(Gln) amidotransferase GatCAB subunit C [Gammaproteobacteria bacterium]
MAIDKATVLRISRLARIHLAEGEIDTVAKELNGIIQWVEQLKEVDTESIEPMTSVVEIELPKREDIPDDVANQKELLSNSPDTEDGFFVVPKVVE